MARDGVLSRLVIAWLCYAQPLVRSRKRYRTRLFFWSAPRGAGATSGATGEMPLCGNRRSAYWSETGCQRTDLLGKVVARLKDERWGIAIDPGWTDWDVEIHGHPWTLLRLCTAQEDHGGPRHLVRVRYALRPTEFARGVAVLGCVAVAVVACLNLWAGAAAATVLAAGAFAAWRHGARLASQVVRGTDELAHGLGLIACPDAPEGEPPAATKLQEFAGRTGDESTQGDAR